MFEPIKRSLWQNLCVCEINGHEKAKVAEMLKLEPNSLIQIEFYEDFKKFRTAFFVAYASRLGSKAAQDKIDIDQQKQQAIPTV